MLIDTHAHLDYPDFAEDFEGVLARAKDAGVTRIITIGTGVESSQRALALAEKYANVYAVVGLHPTNVQDENDDTMNVLRDLARHPKVAAIGETGLDYHHLPSSEFESSPAIAALQADVSEDMRAAVIDGAYKQAQADVFREHLELAVELGLNVVIHQRDAWDDTLDILRPYTGKLRGVYHCFGNRPDQATDLIALGHLVSFTGIITFKNAVFAQQTAEAIGDHDFMVETDCPYLAPVPFRGKRCEPAHTRQVAEKLAEIRGVSLETIAELTTRTAESFFRLSH